MSLPFVGEGWEGVGGGAFFVRRRAVPVIEGHKSRRAGGGLAGWEPPMPAVAPARAV